MMTPSAREAAEDRPAIPDLSAGGAHLDGILDGLDGAAIPDPFVMDAETAAITDRRLGDGRACLSDTRLGELPRLGRRLQRHLGSPQDAEWAIDRDGKLWLTQSRPITTLFPIPEKTSKASKESRIANAAPGRGPRRDHGRPP